MNTSVCETKWLGTLDYNTAFSFQKSLHLQRVNNQIVDQLLFLEHHPVFTKGRRSKNEDLLEAPSLIKTMGADILETDRGGEITFHGPGQLIIYPIISVRRLKGPIQYVRMLEQCIIESLYEFDIKSNCIQGLTGVWVGDNKIAAIGVKISNGISLHGCSINISPDLSWYNYIIPCGIKDKGITSIQKLNDKFPTSLEFAEIFIKRFETIFSLSPSNSTLRSITV
tara:strand:- start:2064 stop:2738 length:675 start_codon:yes stop_codon:yes gene_type:complete